MCPYIGMCMWVLVPTKVRVTGAPKPQVIDSCESLNVGAENQTQVLCKSSTCF